MRTFRFYPEEQHWWSFSDYGHVLDVVQRLRPKRVLEFGPGSSTLALIEGGAEHIDCCEDNPDWFAVYCERLEDRFPDRVTMVPYRWADPLSIPMIDGQRYDLALIDGPHQTEREAAIDYCLQRCAAVLFPTEDWAGTERRPNGHLAGVAVSLAKKYRRPLTITETGPLSGAFALIGPA